MEKELIKKMFINSYIQAGFWSFSLRNEELESYIPSLKDLFQKNGLKTELFLRDENGEYAEYKKYVLSLFDDNFLGYYNAKDDSVSINQDLSLLKKMYSLDELEKDLVEQGSYCITGVIDVFEAEHTRCYENLLSLTLKN